MSEKIKQHIFIILFAILYISVAFVSTFHAISFFSLANVPWIAVMLAITFEIGQAAVLFSILTNNSGKTKIMPWILMSVLTLVQVLGNVYSSYKYLITNSPNLLRFFKEPIFVWMDLPDTQCNVILTYIIGAILPIVSLLMTGMVTNFIGVKNKPNNLTSSTTDTNLKQEQPVDNKNDDETNVLSEEIEYPTDIENNEERPIETENIENEIITEENTASDDIKEKPKVTSHFINL